MVIVVVLIGIIAMIGFPKISKTLDKTNVRSARDAVGTLAGTARAAAIQRGCRSVLHFTVNTVWVTTACPTSVDTISGVQDLRSEEHTSELQSHSDLVCRLLLEKKKKKKTKTK